MTLVSSYNTIMGFNFTASYVSLLLLQWDKWRKHRSADRGVEQGDDLGPRPGLPLPAPTLRPLLQRGKDMSCRTVLNKHMELFLLFFYSLPLLSYCKLYGTTKTYIYFPGYHIYKIVLLSTNKFSLRFPRSYENIA